MHRRDALRLGGLAVAGSLAGCNGLLKTRRVGRAPPVVQDRPDAVYVPSHVEGMAVPGTGQQGRWAVALIYSYPHRFWTITGTHTRRVSIQPDDTVHLMVAVWDAETGRPLPAASSVSVTVAQGGETVDERSPWPMLSQTMGFHYGDNVALPGDGTYAVTVDVGATSLRRFGAFADAFAESASIEIEFDYSRREREQIPYRRLDRRGQRDAVDPMDTDLPLSVAPAEEDLPGEVLGRGTSGDAVFLSTATERDGQPYLAVSPRTPYNGFVLPLLSLSATVARDGETAYDGGLRAALDPELGYHYGATVDAAPGDEVTVTVDAPPQVSRHEGYETAFVEMEPVTV